MVRSPAWPHSHPYDPWSSACFPKCDSNIAIVSIVAGIAGFIIVKLIPGASLALEVGVPLFTSLLLYVAADCLAKRVFPARVDNLLKVNQQIKEDTHACQ
jgi:hypothetical protein